MKLFCMEFGQGIFAGGSLQLKALRFFFVRKQVLRTVALLLALLLSVSQFSESLVSPLTDCFGGVSGCRSFSGQSVPRRLCVGSEVSLKNGKRRRQRSRRVGLFPIAPSHSALSFTAQSSFLRKEQLPLGSRSRPSSAWELPRMLHPYVLSERTLKPTAKKKAERTTLPMVSVGGALYEGALRSSSLREDKQSLAVSEVSLENPSLADATVTETHTPLGSVVTFGFRQMNSTHKWSLQHLPELAGFFLGQSLPTGNLRRTLNCEKRQFSSTICMRPASRGAIESGLGTLLCILAENQTAGVGTRGFDEVERKWISSTGSLSSTYLVSWPHERRELILRLPQIAGLAVLRVLQKLGVGSGARLKWVNDVLVDGRKIAGVLCLDTGKSPLRIREDALGKGESLPTLVDEEEANSIVLIGIGLNVLSHPTEGLSGAYEGAVSILSLMRERRQSPRDFTGRDGDEIDERSLSVKSVKAQLDVELQHLLHTLLSQGPGTLEGELKRSLAFLHQRVGLELPPSNQTPQEVFGILEGVAPDGSLELRLCDGSLRRFTTGRLRKAESLTKS